MKELFVNKWQKTIWIIYLFLFYLIIDMYKSECLTDIWRYSSRCLYDGLASFIFITVFAIVLSLLLIKKNKDK